MSDTIAAIATGSQISAIGIVRLSGDHTLPIIDTVFRPKNGAKMSASANRTLVFGELLDRNGAVLDLCLCTISRGPHSYTGEDTAELQCHGSPVVLREALESLFAAGARQALAGEFTKRAFLNNRLDLTQAEAVIDLIDAETAEAARNAAGQLGGAILRKTDNIYRSLVDITSHYHAVLDYPDEDIDEFELQNYSGTLEAAADALRTLLRSFARGSILQSGLPSAIIGRPNAGKSSLLNALLGYDRAIVTDIPGTTRDTIEEKIRLGGLLLRLSDTAGLRRTDDIVEQIGVDRAVSAAQNANLILAVFDGSRPFTTEDQNVMDTALSAAASGTRTIAIVNKCDLPQQFETAKLDGHFDAICPISAKEKSGLDALDAAVSALFPACDTTVAGEILTNARHADAVGRALTAIESCIASMQSGITPDAVLTDAEDAMSALGELTGRTVREDVTHRIFERFCVGK